jgi:putative flippase GtrA
VTSAPDRNSSRTESGAPPDPTAAQVANGHARVRPEIGAGRHRRSLPHRFAQLCAVVASRLPFGLWRVVAPTFIGFAAINGFTFGVDLLLLTAMHGWLHWPVDLSIALGYATAFGIGFVLNRTLNFRSHAPVGRQTVLYAIAVAINFGAIILGVGAGLADLGVQYLIARIAAGACEGVFMYCALRWVVFNPRLS